MPDPAVLLKLERSDIVASDRTEKPALCISMHNPVKLSTSAALA